VVGKGLAGCREKFDVEETIVAGLGPN
jgi:hypothetical protein